MNSQWFDVDKAGLGKQAEEMPKGRLVGELIQNALDEPGVTRIDVTLAMVPDQALADLTVEDDAPEGFHDFSHAWTLFAQSRKKDNPEQRGQFNIGEKMVLAVCESASICTTKGTVRFDAQQGRIEDASQVREKGSVFRGRIKLRSEEFPQVCDYLRSLLLPVGILVNFNGSPLLARQPIHTFEISLETQIADDHGVMRPRVRKTVVAVYEPLPGETPSLYEMGLPVVETGDKWHVDVGQKVPLNRDRNNVKPAYLRAIRTAVLNQMHDRLTQDDANADWVRQAGSDANCGPAAIQKVLKLRFGDKRAAFDPNDPEANKKWVAEGGTLVYGPMLSPQEWKNAKAAGAIQSTGKLCPTAKPYSQDPDAQTVNVIPAEQWSDGMKTIAEYAVLLGRELMAVPVVVSFVRTPNNFVACYGQGHLDFNVFRLGHGWFDQGATEQVDELLIHEFGHQYSGDHLSEEYHESLCRLGARLKQLALAKPDAIRPFVKQ